MGCEGALPPVCCSFFRAPLSSSRSASLMRFTVMCPSSRPPLSASRQPFSSSSSRRCSKLQSARSAAAASTGPIAAAAFVAIFFFDLPFPLVVIAAAPLVTLLPAAGEPPSLLPPRDRGKVHSRPRGRGPHVYGLRSGLAAPPARRHLRSRACLADIALLFSKLAIVTFGGAYAVLAYMAQQAVETYGWLSPERCSTGSVLPKRRRVRSSSSPSLSASSPAIREGGEPRSFRAARSCCRAMGDICALLPLDLRRRALRRPRSARAAGLQARWQASPPPSSA